MNTGRTPLLDLSIANIYAEYQERQCILYHIGISASTNPVSGWSVEWDFVGMWDQSTFGNVKVTTLNIILNTTSILKYYFDLIQCPGQILNFVMWLLVLLGHFLLASERDSFTTTRNFNKSSLLIHQVISQIMSHWVQNSNVTLCVPMLLYCSEQAITSSTTRFNIEAYIVLTRLFA